jgi:Ca2+-binding RTX toxin-like protein
MCWGAVVGLFGDRTYEEFATILQAANAAFGKSGPNGWAQLKMSEIGIDQFGDVFTSRNGRGKAIVLEKDGELIVAFRGTDKWSDLKDYDKISVVKSYSRQFDKLMEQVAKYQDEHDLHTTFTGISLGGAVTNIVAAKADNQWDGAFKDSSFFGISSPYLANNRQRDLFNLGVQNDEIYGIIPGSWNQGAKDLATQNIFIYLNHRTLVDNLDDSLFAHHVGNFNRAMASLDGLTVADGKLLVDMLNPDSLLIFDQTREVVKASELKHSRDRILTIVGESRKDRINGADDKVGGGDEERIYGMGGNDQIHAKSGRDELHGGSGNDMLDGGDGRDSMFGDGGNDRLVFETHLELGEGGAGKDRFIIRTISSHGAAPASVVITDFTPGEDVLVLDRFDGNKDKKGMQSLHFAGYAVYDADDGLSPLEQGFVNDTRPGSVAIYQDQNGDTLLIINRDGDRAREFEIKFDGALGDFAADLLL